MELWIRTQTNKTLVKVNHIAIREEDTLVYYGNDLDLDKYVTLGKYETEKRALEILDEIQKKMTQTFLLKENEHINYGNMDDLRKYYRRKEINFVEVPKGIELEPINKDILVYEMPEE